MTRTIIVTGATGHQGGAVARHLLTAGWQVRGLTRKPQNRRARALAALGAEMVGADMGDRAALRAAFAGAHGVFSVQNPVASGVEAEIQQGKNVADAAKDVGVQHFVYGSAGTGETTGVGLWDSKLEIEAHAKSLGLPMTILRPMAFMELMTDKGFVPPVSTWHLMPKLMGGARPLPWISVDDVGAIAAKVFADPQRFVGRDLRLARDVRSLDECRVLYEKALHRAPSRFPMPLWLFERVVGKDLPTMWRWLRDGEVDLDTGPTTALHPNAVDVPTWLVKQGRPSGEGR